MVQADRGRVIRTRRQAQFAQPGRVDHRGRVLGLTGFMPGEHGPHCRVRGQFGREL